MAGSTRVVSPPLPETSLLARSCNKVERERYFVFGESLPSRFSRSSTTLMRDGKVSVVSSKGRPNRTVTISRSSGGRPEVSGARSKQRLTQCMVRPCVARGFVNLADAVLHQCIRPLIGACCAPGHHGYQRAFELISGQASKGPFGSPVFACAGKTDPPSSSHPLADLGGARRLGTSSRTP